MKRRDQLPDLSHILDDTRQQSGVPAVPLIAAEKRIHTRFDKAFVVVIGSELYGDSHAIARNVSAGGILVEMCYAPPLGTVVTVHFQYHRPSVIEADSEPAEQDVELEIDELVVRAEVKHHHYLNFNTTSDNEAAASRAIGLRFLEFVDSGARSEAARLH